MLDTHLKHITTEQDLKQTLQENENVMVCCGRMGPVCIPVYGIMEELEGQYPHVAFRDMEFDSPDARIIQTREQVKEILNKEFGAR